MSHHLTQPEEIDQILITMTEFGVEGKPETHPLEVSHDCDGSIGATNAVNIEPDLTATNPGEIP